MQAKLQELTEKVYQEGIGKAKEDSDKIIADARAEAEKILKDARKEADRIKEEAAKKAEEQRRNVDSEIKMASRQLLAALKQQVGDLVTAKMVEPPLGEAFNDADFIKNLIQSVVENWSADQELSLLISKEWEGKLGDFVQSKSLQSLHAGLDVAFDESVGKGFSIGPADGSFRISFTEEGFANFLKDYLRPRATRFLFDEE